MKLMKLKYSKPKKISTNNRSYSQCGEDVIIKFLLDNILHIHDYTYLDIGSNDPTHFNNTYGFYLEGKRGINVDPNPIFKSLYKKQRPHDLFLNAGVGANNNTLTFYEIDPHTLSTFSEKEAIRYTKDGVHKLIDTYEVPIISVDSILKKLPHNLPFVLSLDVEGLDYEIIKSYPFNKRKPAVICVETLTYTVDSSEVKIDKLINLIKRSGYILYADTYINTIFIDKNIWEKR